MLTIEHFYLLLDNHCSNSFQIWYDTSLGQGGRVNFEFQDNCPPGGGGGGGQKVKKIDEFLKKFSLKLHTFKKYKCMVM
jgi:hypothetical protein